MQRMPFLKYVPLFFVGGDFLLNSTQILVDQHPEFRFPVIPFLAERLAGDSDQLVQGYETGRIAFARSRFGVCRLAYCATWAPRRVASRLRNRWRGSWRWISGIGDPSAGRRRTHDPTTRGNLDGEHVPTPARLDKEELFFALLRSSHGKWSGQRWDGGEFRQLLGYGHQRQPVCRGKSLNRGGIHLPRANSE